VSDDLDDYLADLSEVSQAEWDAAFPSVSFFPEGESLTSRELAGAAKLLAESGIKVVGVDRYEDGRARIASITFGPDLTEAVMSIVLQRRSVRVVRRVACRPPVVRRRRHSPRGRRTHSRRARSPGRSSEDPDLPLTATPLRGRPGPAAGGLVVRTRFERLGIARRKPSSVRIVTAVAGGAP
jgi:hypothetical protein